MKYISSTSLWHKVGGSSVGENETSCSTQYYVTRNRLLFADEQAEFFRRSNLSVIKSILRERAFFDGKQNEKYQLYVQTAFLDYFKGYFGEGYYGKRLIKEHFYLPNDFYEIEEDGLNKWFWSKNQKRESYWLMQESAMSFTECHLKLQIAMQHWGVRSILICWEHLGKNIWFPDILNLI